VINDLLGDDRDGDSEKSGCKKPAKKRAKK
jgi:hypothetical protein